MPPTRNRLSRGGGASQEPPEVMTWPKAAPVLIVAVIFDAVRFMFTWLIFFGPAFVGLICGVATGSATVGAVCTVGAGAASLMGAAAVEAFGIMMAMATGFAGWLVVLIILFISNGRIFKENALWFGASLLMSEVPFLNSLPALTFTMWKMHRTQIRVEKAALKKFNEEHAAEQQREQNQQAAQMMQLQAAQQAEFMEQEAANETVYAEAANDEEYGNEEEIPEEVRKVA